jgi:hypothetical protein
MTNTFNNEQIAVLVQNSGVAGVTAPPRACRRTGVPCG